MKAGSLVKWKKEATIMATVRGSGTGVVISIAWTGSNVWVKWPDLEGLQLCVARALEIV